MSSRPGSAPDCGEHYGVTVLPEGFTAAEPVDVASVLSRGLLRLGTVLRSRPTRQGGAAPHGGILQTRSRPHAPRRRQMCTWPPRPGRSPTKRKARRGAGKPVVAAKKLLRCTGDSLSTLTLSTCFLSPEHFIHAFPANLSTHTGARITTWRNDEWMPHGEKSNRKSWTYAASSTPYSRRTFASRARTCATSGTNGRPACPHGIPRLRTDSPMKSTLKWPQRSRSSRPRSYEPTHLPPLGSSSASARTQSTCKRTCRTQSTCTLTSPPREERPTRSLEAHGSSAPSARGTTPTARRLTPLSTSTYAGAPHSWPNGTCDPKGPSPRIVITSARRSRHIETSASRRACDGSPKKSATPWAPVLMPASARRRTLLVRTPCEPCREMRLQHSSP